MHWLHKLLQKVFKVREDSDEEVVKPFLDHMEDLRWTLIKMISTLSGGMIVSFLARKWLFRVMTEPLRVISPHPTDVLIFTGPADSIMVSLTLAFYAGIVLTFPLLLYFLLEFVLPALTRQEKKYVVPGIAVGFALFIIGVFCCYLFVLPQTLKWLYKDAMELGVAPKWMVRDYFSFVTRICLGFGLLAELPPVMTVLAALGFVTHEWLKTTRTYAYVIILALAAFVAPTPDPLTFLMLGLPIIVLYEISIWIAWLLEHRRTKQQREERARLEREEEEWREKRRAEMERENQTPDDDPK